MKDLDKTIFIQLFKEACLKCFDFPLTSALSEADSKLLSNEIFEQTGLVIGAKSIKNYSQYVLNIHGKEVKKENPSVATLDTLARYVLNAPFISEVKRKDNESHYPYWYQYRSRFSRTISYWKNPLVNARNSILVFVVLLVIITGFIAIKYLTQKTRIESFKDNFNSVSEDSIIGKGWIVKSIDSAWWNKRNVKSGHLTLYTLKGDNWSNEENHAEIKNMLMRRIISDCFTAEIHLTNFIPGQSWQQAGILLMEDSTFACKMLRLSISYNDFFGGYEKPPEIIIQIVGSLEDGNRSKPEEIAHIPLYSIEPSLESLVENNLAKSYLKIEKIENHFRFLYITGPMESFAFKEAASGDFNIQPNYISLFAIQGWANDSNPVPIYFDSFDFETIPCKE